MKCLTSLRLYASVCQASKTYGANVRNVLREGMSTDLVWIYPALAALVLLLFILGEREGIPFQVFAKDPLTVANGSVYFGLLSNIGVLFWCATAAVCLFMSSILESGSFLDNAGFFKFSGFLTLQLTLDDLFQLHEKVLPRMFGFRQHYVFLAYLLITAVYLVIYRRRILLNFSLFLFAALLMFTLSLAEDVTSAVLFLTGSQPWHYLVEEGAKLFGIISWFIYFVCISRKELRSCIDSRLV